MDSGDFQPVDQATAGVRLLLHREKCQRKEGVNNILTALQKAKEADGESGERERGTQEQVAKRVWQPVTNALKNIQETNSHVLEHGANILQTCVQFLDFADLHSPPGVEILYMVHVRTESMGEVADEEFLRKIFELTQDLIELMKNSLNERPNGNPLDLIRKIILAGLESSIPEVLTTSSQCCIELCKAKVLGSKHKEMALELAKSVKKLLTSKKAKHRKEMVTALHHLIMNGARPILEDDRDEIEQKSTVYQILVLAQSTTERSEHVRKTVAKILEKWLTELEGRIDHHHQLIPIVLLMISDDKSEIRDIAWRTIRAMGEEKKMEQPAAEPISNMSTRRLGMQEIESFASIHEYNTEGIPLDCPVPLPEKGDSEMEQFCLGPKNWPRPNLYSQAVVKDVARRWLNPDGGYLQKLVEGWGGGVEYRIVSARILLGTLLFLGDDAVQYLQAIFESICRTLTLMRTKWVATTPESVKLAKLLPYILVALGVMVQPKHYLGIVVPSLGEVKKRIEGEDSVEMETDEEEVPIPEGSLSSKTWIKASSTSAQESILVALTYLISGGRNWLKNYEVKGLLEWMISEIMADRIVQGEGIIAGLSALTKELASIRNWEPEEAPEEQRTGGGQLAEWGGDPERYLFGLILFLLPCKGGDAALQSMADRRTEGDVGKLVDSFYQWGVGRRALKPKWVHHIVWRSDRGVGQHFSTTLAWFHEQLQDKIPQEKVELLLLLNGILSEKERRGINLSEGEVSNLLTILRAQSAFDGPSRLPEHRRSAAATISVLLKTHKIQLTESELRPTFDLVAGMMEEGVEPGLRAIATGMSVKLMMQQTDDSQVTTMLKHLSERLDDNQPEPRQVAAQAVKGFLNHARQDLKVDKVVARSLCDRVLLHMADVTAPDVQKSLRPAADKLAEHPAFKEAMEEARLHRS